MAPARSLLLLLLHLIPFVCHALRETVRPLMVFAEPGERRDGRTTMPAGLCLKNEQLLASFISVRPPTAFPPYAQPVASVRWGALGFEVSSEPPDGRRRNCLAIFFFPFAVLCM